MICMVKKKSFRLEKNLSGLEKIYMVEKQFLWFRKKIDGRDLFGGIGVHECIKHYKMLYDFN